MKVKNKGKKRLLTLLSRVDALKRAGEWRGSEPEHEGVPLLKYHKNTWEARLLQNLWGSKPKRWQRQHCFQRWCSRWIVWCEGTGRQPGQFHSLPRGRQADFLGHTPRCGKRYLESQGVWRQQGTSIMFQNFSCCPNGGVIRWTMAAGTWPDAAPGHDAWLLVLPTDLALWLPITSHSRPSRRRSRCSFFGCWGVPRTSAPLRVQCRWGPQSLLMICTPQRQLRRGPDPWRKWWRRTEPVEMDDSTRRCGLLQHVSQGDRVAVHRALTGKLVKSRVCHLPWFPAASYACWLVFTSSERDEVWQHHCLPKFYFLAVLYSRCLVMIDDYQPQALRRINTELITED